jgi:hypothetical protein
MANVEVPRRPPMKCRFAETLGYAKNKEHILPGSARHLATLPLRKGSE